MDSNHLNVGQVIHFVKERAFGFIESEDGEIYFFFQNKNELKRKKKAGLIPYVHNFISGDRVSYKLRSSQRDESKIEAYDVVYISNERREVLINNFEENGYLEGYIKIFDRETIFVKDKNTYVFVPIIISVWEENLEDVYFYRENKLVRFKLNYVKRPDRLSASLFDAKYVNEYYELVSHFENQTHVKAIVTGKSKYGYHATLLNGKVKGFIRIPLNQADSTCHFNKLDEVEVRIKHRVQHSHQLISLTL